MPAVAQRPRKTQGRGSPKPFVFGKVQFVYHYERIREMGHGANQRNLSMAMLKTVELPLPPLNEQIEIKEILSAVDAKFESEKKGRKALDILFKTLLDNLMTGKIRIGEVTALA